MAGVDLGRLAALVQPNTKLISLTSPHNPTGVVLPMSSWTARSKSPNGGRLALLDETYRELSDRVAPPAAVLSARVISVSSISKTYGVPGLRIGWIVNRDARLMTDLLAAKEQIVLAPSVVDEAIALHVLRRRDALLPAILAHARANRAIMTDWIANEPRLEWVQPSRASFPSHASSRVSASTPPPFTSPQHAIRHLGRPRPLVRATARLHADWLRLPQHGRSAKGARNVSEALSGLEIRD